MAASWGTLHDIKCDNMVDQFHKNKEKQQDEPKRPLGVLAVVSGDGWTELYQKLGCDVVSGGQSMNPSVQELNAGIENGRYDKYILLPNNKNIILAAQQLQKMLGEKIHIVPSVNPMEGLAAAMAFMDNIGIEENLNEMSKRVQQIKTGMITAAVRDSLIGDIVIHKGDYMGITKDHQVLQKKISISVFGSYWNPLLMKIRVWLLYIMEKICRKMHVVVSWQQWRKFIQT